MESCDCKDKITFKYNIKTQTMEWYKNGNLHRDNGPAVEFANGYKEWYKNGKLHREDGSAIEYSDGRKYWYINGKLHRDNGPAIEYTDGDKFWYKNGQLHRDDGPAIEYADGRKEWFKDGQKYVPTSNVSNSQKVRGLYDIGTEVMVLGGDGTKLSVAEKAMLQGRDRSVLILKLSNGRWYTYGAVQPVEVLLADLIKYNKERNKKKLNIVSGSAKDLLLAMNITQESFVATMIKYKRMSEKEAIVFYQNIVAAT